MAAIKAVPLGQTDGQRLLLSWAAGAAYRRGVDVERRRDRGVRTRPGHAVVPPRGPIFSAVPLVDHTKSQPLRVGIGGPVGVRQDRADAGAVPGAARPLRHRRGHQRHLHRGRRAVPGAQRGAGARAHHRRRDRRLPAHRDPRGRLDQPGGGRRASTGAFPTST